MNSLVWFIIYVGCTFGHSTLLDSERKNASPLAHGRIVGGTNVSDISLYPHQVAVVQPSSVHGGCIISSQFVLTAAHIYIQDVSAIQVSAGSVLRDLSEGQVVGVTTIIYHPLHSSGTRDYDVAVLQLSSLLTLNQDVWPARFPVAGTIWGIGSTVTMTGWGKTSVGGSYSEVLKEIHLPLVDSSECELTTTITDRRLCIYGYNNNACDGDGGGAVIAYGSTNLVVGIVSYGTSNCDADPYVVVDVAHPEINSFITQYTNARNNNNNDNYY